MFMRSIRLLCIFVLPRVPGKERRKAQREVEVQERQRAEKLSLLVEKFGKNR